MRNAHSAPKLHNGAKVGIVGGGPAGSFFALHLLKFAAEQNLSLEVTIFEARSFDRSGPPDCARCAGLLSAGLQDNLRQFGLDVPPHVIQSRADSYVLHLAQRAIEIFPPVSHHEIVSVYRSNGPRLADPDPAINFDHWLLQRAEAAGATVQRAVVKRIAAAGRPVIETLTGEYPVDLAVLAAGLNGRRVKTEGIPYHPPKTELMIQDELSETDPDRRVHVYFDPQHGIVFGAAVPKGNFINVSLLGRPAQMDLVDTFLRQMGVSGSYYRLCGCKPKIAISPAEGYFADRFVAVGDAAATRLYKDGIGSAFRTGRQAAHTAIFHGIAAGDFQQHYRPLCRAITFDNFWGRVLFFLWDLTARSPRLTQLWLRALTAHNTHPFVARRCTLALWNMFSGGDSYFNIFKSLIDPRVLWMLLSVGLKLWRQFVPSEGQS